MTEKLDKETRDNLTEGEKWKHFVEGEMWQKARVMLADKIIDVQSVNNIDETDPHQALHQIQIRRGIAELVWEWIQEIEGQAEQHEFNSKAYQEEEYIIRKD